MRNRNMWTTSKVILKALKFKHQRYFTVSIKQFIGKEQMPHNLYTLSEAVYNPNTGKYYNKDVYTTASMIRIVLYLRDILDILEGRPVAIDQPLWNDIREELVQSGKYWSREFNEQ